MTRPRLLATTSILVALVLTDCVLSLMVAGGPRTSTEITAASVTTPSDSTRTRTASGEPARTPGSIVTPTTQSSGLSQLETLPIKGRAPRTGYDRSVFGQRWSDVDRNGCDTRNDILRRDLIAVTIKPGTNGCKVTAGTLHDPYSGGTFAKDQVQIDHVVALSDAWQKGAQSWTATKRLAFANDATNLQATSGTLNQRKSDSDAASWLPPNKSYRCRYVSRQVAVKASYGLWVTQAEHDAIVRVLASCETAGSEPTAAAPGAAASTRAVTATSTQPPASSGGCDPSYPGVCIPPVEVAGDLDCPDIPERKFVVAPPDPHRFDGNHDGVGCEG